jgi:nicotinate-nucleotide adenylyltransferase
MEQLGFEWNSMSRLGIIGGTFDPIHRGHLAAADAACQHYHLDRVLFIPSGHPPHKSSLHISPARDRYLMALLATCNTAGFHVSQVELMRTGTAYTIDTLRLLHSWIRPDCRLFFIVGADMAIDLPTWREPDAILAEAQVVALSRPGYDLSAVEEVLGPARAAQIEPLYVNTPNISATDIRRCVASGSSIAGLTSESVRQYIAALHLYTT